MRDYELLGSVYKFLLETWNQITGREHVFSNSLHSFVLLSGQQDHDMNIKRKNKNKKHRLDIFVTIVIDTASLT